MIKFKIINKIESKSGMEPPNFLEKIFGTSYFYCIRKSPSPTPTTTTIECIRYDNMNFYEADTLGLQYFKDNSPYDASTKLFYNRLLPNFFIKYRLRFDLMKSFHPNPIIVDNK